MATPTEPDSSFPYGLLAGVSTLLSFGRATDGHKYENVKGHASDFDAAGDVDVMVGHRVPAAPVDSEAGFSNIFCPVEAQNGIDERDGSRVPAAPVDSEGGFSNIFCPVEAQNGIDERAGSRVPAAPVDSEAGFSNIFCPVEGDRYEGTIGQTGDAHVGKSNPVKPGQRVPAKPVDSETGFSDIFCPGEGDAYERHVSLSRDLDASNTTSPRVISRAKSQSQDEVCRQAALNLRLFCLLMLWAFSVYAWRLGAFLHPTLEIRIMPGTPFASTYKRSLVYTLVDLYNTRSYLAFSVLAFFSVLVPPLKLLSTLFVILQLMVNPVTSVYNSYKNLIWTLSYIASYQLLDLYVGILFVVHFNSDSADSKFLAGFFWFYAYCMASMLMSVGLDGAFYSVVEVERLYTPVAARYSRSRDSRSMDDDRLMSFRSLPNSATQRLKEQTQRLKAGNEKIHLLPYFIDAKSTVLLSFAFVVLFCCCFPGAVLEVHTVWQGVSVDRSVHPLMQIFCGFLEQYSKPWVAFPILAMNVVLPLVYVSALAGLSSVFLSTEQCGMCDGSFAKSCSSLADLVRPWSTIDVFCFASLVFLFTVQDGRTLTMPLQDSANFYIFVGVGFCMFFLRWLSEGGQNEVFRWGYMLAPRFWLVILAWLLVCGFISGRIGGLAGHQEDQNENRASGSSRYYEFESFDAVCDHAMPILMSTLKGALPATFGNCSDRGTNPPMPCSGEKPLYHHRDGDDFINAVWLSGINAISLNYCHLWKDPPADGTTKYHMTFRGKFDYIHLYLQGKQCGNVPFLGCTSMNSSKHCCGDDIKFNITFELLCSPSEVSEDAFRDVSLESCGIESPMLVDTDYHVLGGNLGLGVLDIGPLIQGLLRQHISDFLRNVKLEWAGEEMHASQLVNRLIAYNAPGSVGSC